MKSTQISKDGTQRTKELGRRALAVDFDLHHRDLRPLFSVRQVATIFSRGEAIIANLGLVKLLISKDRVLVFNLDNPDIKNTFIPGLKDKLKNITKDHHFELVALDFAMNYKVQNMKSQSADLEKSVNKVLKILNQDYGQINLEKLLKLKKKISKFEIAVRENQEAGEEILEDDDELIDLCLSQKKKKIVDFEEAESILDSYVEQVEDIAHRVDELNENIDDTQEILSLKINSLRNSIIKFELIATLLAALFSLFAVITGLYGMNIRNNLEENPIAFGLIAMSFVLISFVLSVITWRFLKHKKVV